MLKISSLVALLLLLGNETIENEWRLSSQPALNNFGERFPPSKKSSTWLVIMVLVYVVERPLGNVFAVDKVKKNSMRQYFPAIEPEKDAIGQPSRKEASPRL